MGYNRVYYLLDISESESTVKYIGSGLGAVSNVAHGSDGFHALTRIDQAPGLNDYTRNLGVVAYIPYDL